MVTRFLFSILLMTAGAVPALGQLALGDSTITEVSSNLTLSASKKYLLSGFVNVNPPATLTIPAGTLIFGEASTKGSLIINRGAKVYANGTADAPIVFTSQYPPGQRNSGDWGGIIMAGNAAINVPGGTATIEGGTGTVYGGGGTPDDDDSSGVLRYVRLEFSGIAFLPDNEINGLTMGGVGRKTVIEYVQISYCGDDSFEWFGGTVNGRYLISWKPVDDDFDTDLGFRGRVQFGMSVRDPDIADVSGSNGFESDNDGTGTFNAPRTAPIFSNMTMVGPMPDTSATAAANHRRGIHLRRSTLTSIYNSIFMGYRTGALLDGTNVANAATADTLQIRNSIWAGLRQGNGLTSTVGAFDAESWYASGAYSNRRYTQPSEVMLTDPFNLASPNPVPQNDSPALTGADFSNPRLQEPFFAPTAYVGAFGQGVRWDAGWANYDPQGTVYVTSVERVGQTVPESFHLSQNYPNPFNPATTIAYAVPAGGTVSLKVYNMVGELVETLVERHLEAGEYRSTFDASGLSSGVYFYRLTGEGFQVTRSMVLMK